MDLSGFISYLTREKQASDNTVTAYVQDVRGFARYLGPQTSLVEANKTDVLAYMMQLGKEGKSRATQSRRLASLRAFYRYGEKAGHIRQDPTEGIKGPGREARELVYLRPEEIEKLLAQPDDTVKGKRDRAILEILYGTGIRSLELIDMNLADADLRIGFVTCSNKHGRPRIIPLGSYARHALQTYLTEARPVLLHKQSPLPPAESPLFVNYRGERMSRQGLWKLLRAYGKKAGLDVEIGPGILRTSFAVHMTMNGADMKTLQELLGYDNLQAMETLLGIRKNRIKDVYDKTFPRA